MIADQAAIVSTAVARAARHGGAAIRNWADIEVPLVAGPRPSSFQFVGEQPAEAQAPLADGIVADYDTTGGEDGLDIPRLRLKQ